MKKILLILSLLWAYTLFPQGQAANWYFGYGAGLKFNLAQNTVSSVNDGQLFTNEGCASISDENGNLLFYTDGSTVYTRTHQRMQNGVGLFGDASSTQSAIIVPKPKDDNIYYIFTVDNFLDGFNFGLNYSVVDISANGGEGRLIERNVKLLNFCSEKITVVKNGTDCDVQKFWLVTLSTENGDEGPMDTYHSFEINENGVETNSVKSNFILGSSSFGVQDARGYLVLSPDGKRIASANMRDGLYLYDFDVVSGSVSNQQKLNLDVRAFFAYGVAFSPDNNLLYVHSSNDYFAQDNSFNDPSNHYSILTQFNLSATDIQSSAAVLDARNLYRGALQLGPDGRIYRALSATYNAGLPFLGIIRNPNGIGANADYRHNAISVAPNESTQGFPPFIQSIFNPEIDIIRNGRSSTSLPLCSGDSYVLRADDLPNASYSWTRNGVPIPENGFELTISSDGQYEVLVDPNNGDCTLEGEAFVSIVELPEAKTSELIQCDVDGINDGLSTFNLSEADNDILDGNENLSITYYSTTNDAENGTAPLDSRSFSNSANPQTVYAKVTDEDTGCYTVSSLNLIVIVTNPSDTQLINCDDDGAEDGLRNFDLSEARADLLVGLSEDHEVTFYNTQEDALLEINSLGESFTNEQPNSQTIFARIENENACFAINRVELIVNQLPQILTEETVRYCINKFPDTITLDSALLEGTPDDYSYEWSTGETTESILINDVGSYSVTVSKEFGCSKERTITVNPSNIATIDNIEVVDVSNNNIITVFESGEGDYEYSLDDEFGIYQDSNSFENVSAGIHTVFVQDKNSCGTVRQDVSVIGFPKFFSPNNDGINDYWNVKGISSQFQPNTIIYIYDRFGKLLKQLNPLEKGWDGKLNGKVLNSTDYWFSVTLEDGRLFKGHFSLRR